jgi:GntR family transcriptional regulator/MocR family aminotransferase
VTEPLFEIEIDKPAKGARDAGDAIYRQLKAAILDGRLPVGFQLPPSRRSGSVFGVSRNTMVAVYERLWHEGDVVLRRGSGAYVAEPPPRKPPPPESPEPSPPYARLNTFWLRHEVKSALGFWRLAGDDAPAAARGEIDLRPAVVDQGLFPNEAFRRAMAQQLRRLERAPARLRSPEGGQGSHFLRAAIARQIAVTRAIACRPEEVIVTAGAQQAFDLLARTLVGAQETVVAVEDPGYPPMRVAFAAAGARLVSAPVDADGLIVEALPADTNVICLCPSHQFPLGAALSPERREALIAFARRHGAVIVEDDYDGEFRYDRQPVGALQALAPGQVVYAGTASKSLAPGLRLGWLVVPPRLLDAVTAELAAGPSGIDQLTLAEFITSGDYDRQIRRARLVYRRRRDRLAMILNGEELRGQGLRISGIAAGLHAVLDCSGPSRERDIIARDAEAGLALDGLERFRAGAGVRGTDGERAGLVIGYSRPPEHAYTTALARLRAVLAQ